MPHVINTEFIITINKLVWIKQGQTINIRRIPFADIGTVFRKGVNPNNTERPALAGWYIDIDSLGIFDCIIFNDNGPGIASRINTEKS